MPAESSLTIDPDVKLPAAVKAAMARSDQLHNELRDNPVQPQEEGDGDQVTGEGNPGETPLTAQPSAQPAAQPAAAEKPAKAAKQAKAAAEPAEDWEHLYKSDQGRVPSLQRANAALSEEVNNLRELIATLQASGTAKPAAEPAARVQLVTDEETNEYGKDLLDVVGRRAREEVAPLLEARDQEIAQLKSQLDGVNGVVQMSARDKLHAELDNRMPDWRKINTDQNFLSWLGLPDAYSGAIRHEMLKAAYTQGNASRVLAFFNGFLSEEATVAPQAQPVPGTTTVQKVPLQNLAAPGKAKAAATTVPGSAEKPIITRAEITQFYADCTAGRYRTREPERQRIEAEIFSAQREGRIAS
jgi:hypothetical protein